MYFIHFKLISFIFKLIFFSVVKDCRGGWKPDWFSFLSISAKVYRLFADFIEPSVYV